MGNLMVLEATLQDSLRGILGDAAAVLVVFGAVFSLLNCFLGYRLVKLWSALCGFAVGWVAAFAVSMHFLANAGVSAVIGIAAGLLLGGIAFFLYKAGVFVLCVFLVFFLCVGLIPIQWLAIVLGLALGLAVGVLAMKFMREVLIFTTAISGGMNAANALLPVFGLQNAAAALIVGLALAVLGIVVQWKTTAKA